MADHQSLTVPWMGPTGNKVFSQTMHFGKRSQLRNVAHLAVRAAVCNAKLKPVNKPVKLIFKPHMKGRFYDIHNYWFTNKLIEDGLVTMRILEDDSPRFVRSIETVAPIKTKKQSFMVVEIMEINDNPAKD